MSLPSDNQQRQQALDLNHSFLVGAPAGSGKTELLIQRFLKALACVDMPEQVMAITFTKKAASEMKARIQAALDKAQQNHNPTSNHEQYTLDLARNVLDQDKQQGWHLHQSPHRLMIMTIDALCQALLPEPLAVHSAPSLLYRQAAEACCLHFLNHEQPAFLEWLLHMDHRIDRLLHLFEKLLTHRDQWLPLWSNQESLDIQMQKTQTMLTIEHLNALHATFPNEQSAAFDACLSFAQEHGLNALPLSLSQALKQNDAQALLFWQQVAAMLLTQKGEIRKKGQKKQGFPAQKEAQNKEESALFNEMKASFEQLQIKWPQPFLQALIAIERLPKPDDWLRDQTLLSALSELLPTLAAFLNITFTEVGSYDFIHIALNALWVQSENDLPCALKTHFPIEHLLIDEFQDTSRTQFHLFTNMIKDWREDGPQSLFMVGDPMQSIYRFRQAEVALFYQVAEHGIGHLQPKILQLTQNFRATQGLIDWNNQCFSNLFTNKADHNIGAVPFHPSTAMQAGYHKPQYHWLEGHDDAQQAHHIAQSIATLKQQHPTDSIAILLRSRQKLTTLLNALRQAHLTVCGEGIIPLNQHPVIQDLCTLTELSYHPQNKLHWLAFLRSPFCGLNHAELHRIHPLFQQGMHGLNSLEQALTRNTLDPQTHAIMIHIVAILQKHFASTTHQSAKHWIETLWHRLQGAKAYQDPTNSRHVAHFFFQSLEQSSLLNPSAPYQSLERLLTGAHTDLISEHSDVEIMTLHKAKGLEFDHVFIPFLEGKPPPRSPDLFSWHTLLDAAHTPHTLFTIIPEHKGAKHGLHRYSDHLEKQKEAQERLRLLYVGATRAKQSLHFIGSLEQDKPRTGSLMHLLAPDAKPTHHVTMSNHASIQRPYYRIQPTAHTPKPHWAQSQALSYQDPGYSYEQWLGLCIHQGLYLLSQHQPHKPLSCYLKAIKQWGMKQGLQQQLDQLAQQKLHQVVASALTSTLNDPRGLWLLSDHLQHQSEYTLYHMDEEDSVQSVIDRTFIDDGVRWVIDYKTTVLTDPNALREQQTLHQAQLHRYAALFNELTIKCALYFPRQGLWHAWDYDALDSLST